MIKMKRVAGAVLPVAAAAVLLTAVPADAAGYRWSSCYNGKCDWGYVDGTFSSILDESDDGIDAALDIRTYDGGTYQPIASYGRGVVDKWLPSPVNRARICNYSTNVGVWGCGGWKYF